MSQPARSKPPPASDAKPEDEAVRAKRLEAWEALIARALEGQPPLTDAEIEAAERELWG